MFNLFKSKKKIQQHTHKMWALKMSSIVPQEQVLELSAEEIYNRVRLAETSQNCISASEGYFETSETACSQKFQPHYENR